MAITNAIMQMRRGNEADFNPENMRVGEWAVSLDTKYVRMCFAPNVCVRMATYEAFEEDMETVQQILSTCETIQSAVESIQANIEGIEVVVENYVNSSNASALLSESYAIGGTGSRIGEDTDNAMYYKEQARIYSERAESVTDVSIATLDKAGIVKPDGETIDVGLDGTISVVGEFGTADYTDLQNKPTLNGITLEGNKTLEEFGAFSGNYNDLENKPTIPSVATSTVAGTVKPDGTTTEVDEDGTLHVIGGGGTSVDILPTKEEVEANTEAGKIADALVTKELSAEIAQISSSLSAIKQSIGGLNSSLDNEWKLLWSNPTPNIAVAGGQQFYFDTSRHTIFAVIGLSQTVKYDTFNKSITLMVKNMNMICNWGENYSGMTEGGTRGVVINDKGLYILTDGVSTNSQIPNNNYGIPLFVYGIK